MSVIVYPQEASPDALAPLSALLSANLSSKPSYQGQGQQYEIRYFQRSVSAWILFVRNKTGRRVLKLLCDYKDIRYELETPQKRLNCQIEAFRCNSAFSPESYFGLARITDFDASNQTISISEISTDFCHNRLTPDGEYALVMCQLHSHRRLDYLLANEYYTTTELEALAPYLTNHIVQMHKSLPHLLDTEIVKWGSFDQIRSKLIHNLTLAHPINPINLGYPLSEQATGWLQVKSRFEEIEKALKALFTRENYKEYAASRIAGKHIKKCHADLKGPNMWVCENDYDPLKEPPEFTSVSVIDAVDFNAMYSNIDTLSDFATLAIDIQTRIQQGTPNFAEDIARQMVDMYLAQMNQENEAARAMIHFYLVEKAYIGAAISIVYDDLPDLGLRFLNVAEKQLASLENYLKSQKNPSPPVQICSQHPVEEMSSDFTKVLA